VLRKKQFLRKSAQQLSFFGQARSSAQLSSAKIFPSSARLAEHNFFQSSAQLFFSKFATLLKINSHLFLRTES